MAHDPLGYFVFSMWPAVSYLAALLVIAVGAWLWELRRGPR